MGIFFSTGYRESRGVLHMAPQQPIALPSGYLATDSGLVAPAGYLLRSSSANAVEDHLRHYRHFCATGFSYGLRLERDPDTLVIQWAPKGSGIDDYLLAAIADGRIANVGIAPVMFAQLTALIHRRQDLINSASVVVTGRAGAATRALNGLARMNDSPIGVIDGMKQVIYQLDTFNRGAPLATIPITYPVGRWGEEGMTLRPILDSKGKESGRYWIEMDWRGRTPVPYLPSVFDLEPTDSKEWPYWYRVQLDDKKVWVLLHYTQCLGLLSTKTNQPGIGTAPVWTCLPILAEHALAIDERYEKLIDQPSEGLLAVSGVTQTAEQIRKKLEEPDQTWTLLTAPNEVKFSSFSFRQPDGIDWAARKAHFEDVLAAAFNEHLTSVVIRGGQGYGIQGEVSADNVAEGGVFAVLQAIEIAFGAIYPRVSIQVTKANDRARRLGLELLTQFAAAVGALPEGTLTRAEIRALIDRDHLTIPVTTDDMTQSDARPGSGAENEGQRQDDELMAEEIGLALAECRRLLAQVVALTPEAQLVEVIARARAVAETIRPEARILQLIALARRFALVLHEAA